MRAGKVVSGLASSLAIVVVLASAGCTIEGRVGSGSTEPVNWNGGSGGTTVTTNVPRPAPMPNVPPPTTTQPTTPPAPGPGPRRIAQIPKPNPSGGGTKFVPVPIARNNGLFGGPNVAALRGLVYFIPETTMSFPDVSNMKPSALVYTDTLDIAAQDFTQGIGGTNRLEFYAIQYDGNFTTSKAGLYTFILESSDGSKLYIDGNQVIDNDQRHTPVRKAGDVTLAAGSHTIRVDFFKAYRWVVALRLTVVPAGETTERVWTPKL